MYHRDRDDRLLRARYRPTHDALQCHHHVRRHQHRVDRQMRLRAVAATADDLDLERRRVRHHRARTNVQVAELEGRPVVIAVAFVDAVEASRFNHWHRASRPLFRWLEEQPHTTVRRERVRATVDERRGAHERCHVAVVAAHVRDALVLGSVGQGSVALGHAQCVHISAQRNRAYLRLPRRGRSNPHDVSNNTRPCAIRNAALVDAGQHDQHLAQQLIRVLLLKAWLWIRMNLTTETSDGAEQRI
mmetsp:Transcript_24568/g.53630  ORF Transcript_24568/g.53630 Transcript_24568/m.53630 type:complete len:245 (+) Transcript_24568:1222-1956(+)